MVRVKNGWLWGSMILGSLLLITSVMTVRSYVLGLYGKDHFYDSIIKTESERTGLPTYLIKAVIWKESRFDARAYGKAEERGLMQVTPVAAQEWADAEGFENFSPVDLFNPRTNIRAGSWYLARAKSRWPHADKPIVFALAEYNAGRTHALRWSKDLNKKVGAAFIEKITFPTTKRYILDILDRQHHYKNEPEPVLWELLWHDIRRFWGHQAPEATK